MSNINRNYTINEMVEQLEIFNNSGGDFGFAEIAMMHDIEPTEENINAMVEIAIYWEDGWSGLYEPDHEEISLLNNLNLLNYWGFPKKFTERWYKQALRMIARSLRAEGLNPIDLIRH